MPTEDSASTHSVAPRIESRVGYGSGVPDPYTR